MIFTVEGKKVQSALWREADEFQSVGLPDVVGMEVRVRTNTTGVVRGIVRERGGFRLWIVSDTPSGHFTGWFSPEDIDV